MKITMDKENKNIVNRQRMPKIEDITQLMQWLYDVGIVENIVRQYRKGELVDDIIQEVWVEIGESADKLIELANKNEYEVTGYVSGLIARALSKNGRVNRRMKKYHHEVTGVDYSFLENKEVNDEGGEN